jgi:hypothetical protein
MHLYVLNKYALRCECVFRSTRTWESAYLPSSAFGFHSTAKCGAKLRISVIVKLIVLSKWIFISINEYDTCLIKTEKKLKWTDIANFVTTGALFTRFSMVLLLIYYLLVTDLTAAMHNISCLKKVMVHP